MVIQLEAIGMNVSQVRKYSPFRYPGGKTWFVTHIRHWLKQQTDCRLFVEPFCGGGIVGLTVAAEGLAQKVVLSELDSNVAAVWHICLSPTDSEKLTRRILDFDVNSDTVMTVLESQPTGTLERAFRTIVFNRVSRGGITLGEEHAPSGAGILKRGENNKGLGSRWYPDTLANRIRFISTLAPVVDFIEDDGFATIDRFAHQPNTAFFIDPPYTAGTGKRAGTRLYQHSSLDHPKLFDTMAAVEGRFVMTYDDDTDVVALAVSHQFHLSRVAMRSAHHREVQELVITDHPWPARSLWQPEFPVAA